MDLSLKRTGFRLFKKIQTRRHELNYLFWECTTRCNMNCLHCGSDCYKEGSSKDMPFSDFLRALNTVRSPSKIFTVVLTGGEPLLRNDLATVGREIRKRGMRWGMVSNGYLYNPERHSELLSAGMGSLTLSLDGLEGSHNWLRNNRNSYASTDRAIGLAAGSGRLNFDVVTCVNQHNLVELQDIYRYLLKKGVRAWRLFTIAPIGRAAGHPELFLGGPEFQKLMEFITLKRKEGEMDVKFSCEGYVGKYENKVRDTPFFCRAGINIGSVLIDGSISACPNIDRSFAQGNIYEDDFFEVWEKRFQSYRDRSWTRRGKCASCIDYRDCLGNGLHLWHGEKKEPLVCHKEWLEQVNAGAV